MSESNVTLGHELEPDVIKRSPYQWFTVLWPLAIIFHLAGNDGSLLRFTSLGVIQLVWLIAAIALLFRPTPATALLVALVHIPIVLVKLPVVGNHEILLLLIDLTVILAVVTKAMEWVTTKAMEWVSAVVVPLRWVLLIAYSAFAFSKLNSSFVDRAVSCAVVFGDELSGWAGFSVSGTAILANMVIAVALLAELSIPFLLMIRRTRRVGVLVGLVFHTAVALEPAGHVFDFTSVLFVLFLLFLSPESSTRLDEAIVRLREGKGNLVLVAILAIMATGNVVMFRLTQSTSGISGWLFDYPFFLAYAGLLLWTVARILRRSESPAPKIAFRLAPVMAVVVLLTSLNAVSPYLELRTAGAFNMYSNLSVLDGETNHFLLPATLPLRETPRLYAHDPAEAETQDGQSEGLEFYAPGGFVIPEANLAQWANINQQFDVEVHLVTGDGQTTIVTTGEVAATANPADSLVERVLFIRPVDHDGSTSCRRTWGPAN